MSTYLNFQKFFDMMHSNLFLSLLFLLALVLLFSLFYLKKSLAKIGLLFILSILALSIFLVSEHNLKINRFNNSIAFLPSLSFVKANTTGTKSIFAASTFRTNKSEIFTKSDKKMTSLNEEIAQAYGVSAFSKVEKMDYTFNVEFNGKKFSRKWEWNPKTKEITYWGKDKNGKNETLTYNRNDKMDAKTKKIDAAFINDNYWLLFPFHLVWDTNVKFTDEGIKKYPIGKGEGQCLSVKYSDKVGYTPGDQFNLFLNKNNMIHQWIYLHGGSKKNPRPATWEGNKSYGGFTISTLHYGPDKKFKLWFSDIKVDFKK